MEHDVGLFIYSLTGSSYPSELLPGPRAASKQMAGELRMMGDSATPRESER